MAGGYTAYQLYADSQYQEAESATVQPYVNKAYRCPQSQRGGLAAGYDSYSQRIQFDAANTSCCDEPVQTFGTKTQYSLITTPPKTKDCIQQVKVSERCDHLVVINPAYKVGCNASGMKGVIKVQCPNLIKEISGKTKGSIPGKYGTFTVNGMYNPRTMKLTYAPSETLITEAYQHCQSTTYQDTLGRIKVTWRAQAGLDSPSGCYCDCCNTYGHFVSPTHVLTANDLISTYENSYSIPGGVQLSTACKDGSMGATLTMNVGGSMAFPWIVSPAYYSNGTTRYWYGTPGTIGDANHPACCGASVYYSTTDGCGHSDWLVKNLNRKPVSAVLTPNPGTLYAGTSYTATVAGACNLSNLTSILMSYSGLATTAGNLNKGVNGQITRTMGTLTFSNYFANKGCCGNGSVTVTSWNDGCNTTGNRTWPVKNPYSTGSTLIGSLYRINFLTPYYYVQRSGLRCDGISNASWSNLTSFLTLAEAIAYVDSASDSQIINDCQNNSYCPSPATNTCCRYVNNGSSTLTFQAAIFCVNNTGWSTAPICCRIPFTQNAAWVYSSSSYCCAGD